MTGFLGNMSGPINFTYKTFLILLTVIVQKSWVKSLFSVNLSRDLQKIRWNEAMLE
jgi:hypothetical protein